MTTGISRVLGKARNHDYSLFCHFRFFMNVFFFLKLVFGGTSYGWLILFVVHLICCFASFPFFFFFILYQGDQCIHCILMAFLSLGIGWFFSSKLSSNWAWVSHWEMTVVCIPSPGKNYVGHVFIPIHTFSTPPNNYVFIYIF